MSPVPGEPKPSRKPEPIGSFPMVVLFTTCTLCVLFLLWRRADSLRRVVSHRLQTFTQRQGHIRLSEDDGPPANEFLVEDYDDDNEHLRDDEPLSEHIRNVTRAWREPNVKDDANGDSNERIKTLPISQPS